jgi:hypothetical protein
VTLAALLAGLPLGLLAVAALAGGVAAGSRVLAATGARAEVEDTTTGAVEAFTADVRRAGFDPAASGGAGLLEARTTRLVLAADLDGDGAIDTTSEERVTWACLTGPPRLQRIVGTQSLPLAADVAGCRFAFVDAAGAELAVPAAGLDAAGRAAVRAVLLDVVVAPPALHATSARRALVALWRAP